MNEEYEIANQFYLNALASGADQSEADETFLFGLRYASQPQEERMPGNIMERVPPEWAPKEAQHERAI